MVSQNFQRRGVVSVDELERILHEPDLVIVDCRFYLGEDTLGRDSYLTSHIPYAVYAHLNDDLSTFPGETDNGRHPLPSPEQLTKLFSQLGIDNTKTVIVYDQRNGAIASRLWWMLRYMEHTNVFVLDGGWQAWEASEKPIKSGLEKNEATTFVGNPTPSMFITIDEVPNAELLVDSRAPERYRGETEPIDPIAGHISGAQNLHFSTHWDKNGQIKSPSLIKSQFDTLLSDQTPENTVFYCGSGVTACANLLAMHYAGLPLGKLYVGSWSEWSRRLIQQEIK